MSLIKNQFFEKKITQLFQIYPYVLIFHYNNITSKEWLNLKQKLFQINPLIQNKVIPNRFLSQLWKNLKFEEISGNSKNKLSIVSEKSNNDEYNLGSSCLFFCSTKNDLKQIYEVTDTFKISGNTQKFLNIGMVDTSLSENQRQIGNPKDFASQKDKLKAIFFNSYDIKRMLELNSDIFFQLVESFNRNNHFMTNLNNFLSFSNTGFLSNSPFRIHHYNLINILHIHSSKLAKANNGN